MTTVPPEELDEYLGAIGDAETMGDRRRLVDVVEALEAAAAWKPQPYQEPPPGDWWMWVFSGGAGSGKTDAGAWWINQHMEGPACDERLPGGHKSLLAGPTFSDAIGTMWSAPAGLTAHNPGIVKTGRQDGTYAVWPNGAEALFVGLHSEHDADLLRARAANACCWWLDEAAIARHLKLAVDMITLRARAGLHPHGIATSTPKPSIGWKYLINLPGVVVTRASSYDNAYLSEGHKRVIQRFRGTRLEAQEIHGMLLDDYEGALWNRENIVRDRITDFPADISERLRALGIQRVAIGIDPSTWDPDLGDDPGTVAQGIETGIIVVGIDAQDPPHLYVLDDLSRRAAAEAWAAAAVGGFYSWDASFLVPETNLGGMVLSTIRMVDPNVAIYRDGKRVGVRAAVGKRARAEPVSLLSDQGRWHHVGDFPELESQMCQWDPRENWSPDRIDAAVWAAYSLNPVESAPVGTSARALLAAGSLTGRRSPF